MASGMYNRGKLIMVDGTVNWGTTVVRVALVTSTYTPNADHNFVSDLTNELSGGNYARGELLSETGPTENDTDDSVDYDANDLTFTALEAVAGSPQYAIVYDDTEALDSAKQLIAWFDLGVSPAVPNGGDYTLQWPAPMLRLS